MLHYDVLPCPALLIETSIKYMTFKLLLFVLARKENVSTDDFKIKVESLHSDRSRRDNTSKGYCQYLPIQYQLIILGVFLISSAFSKLLFNFPLEATSANSFNF